MVNDHGSMGMICARRAYRSQYDRGRVLLARGFWWDCLGEGCGDEMS